MIQIIMIFILIALMVRAIGLEPIRINRQILRHKLKFVVSAEGIEPSRITPTDFKSVAFTYFATPTYCVYPFHHAREGVSEPCEAL